MIRAMLFEAPLDCGQATVLPEWIDYNGHMNVAYYVLAFDQALDRTFDRFDCGQAYVQRTNRSYFVLEAHVRYLQEVTKGDPLSFTFHLIDLDAKRLHYFVHMYHAEKGYLAATSEQVAMHIDLADRRSAPMPPEQQALFEGLARAHAGLPLPEGLGRTIRLRKPAAA